MRNSRLNHSLRGQATAYGRGLSLAQARASYAMEIVERASAYVSVGPGQAGIGGEVLDRKLPLLLIKARYADLKAQGRAVLDPGLLPLEASCPDAPLYWLTARAVDGAEVLVPAQAVFLFCNLDEPGLFLAGGSTGLASGNSLDEASPVEPPDRNALALCLGASGPLRQSIRARPGGLARARAGRSAGLQPAVGRGQSALAGKRAGRARQKPALCGPDPGGPESARGPRSDSGPGAYRRMGPFFAAKPPAFRALCGHV